MKKNYSFYLSLLAIPIFAVLFLSFGAGQDVYYVSGSPSDNLDPNNDQGSGIIGNCATCHTGSSVISNSPTITMNVPTDYELSTTYSITVSSNSAATRQGFQMSVEDNRDNKVGDFTDDGSSSRAFTSPLGDRGEAITHTGSGAFQNSWTFDWTSPATDVGPITFYVALNESNQDFNSTGDQIHLKQSSANLLSVENYVFNDLKVYPNPATNFVTVNLPASIENTSITVFDFLGKQIITQNLENSNTIDVSTLQSGVYLLQLNNGNASITKRFIKK